MFYLGLFYPLYIASVYKPIAQNILHDSVLTFAGALGSVCNGCSRIFWAWLSDKYGFRKVYAFLLLIELVTAATVWYARKSAFLYPICIAASFFCEGGHFSLFSAAAANIFGLKSGGLIFTVVFSACPFASTTSFLLVNFGGDVISTEAVLQIATVLTAVNCVLLYFFDDSQMKSSDE